MNQAQCGLCRAAEDGLRSRSFWLWDMNNYGVFLRLETGAGKSFARRFRLLGRTLVVTTKMKKASQVEQPAGL